MSGDALPQFEEGILSGVKAFDESAVAVTPALLGFQNHSSSLDFVGKRDESHSEVQVFSTASERYNLLIRRKTRASGTVSMPPARAKFLHPTATPRAVK